jgi:hypothetical protein
MSNLKTTIDALAADFAHKLIVAIKSASFQEILSVSSGVASRGEARRPSHGASPVTSKPRRGKGGRLLRRSPSDIEKVKSDIVALLAKHAGGLRAEEIRSQLGLSKQEVPRPISDALAEKLITKKGQKRATTYFKMFK